MENIFKKTWILKGLVLTLSICFIAFWGVIGVYADDYEEDPVIEIGKDVTVTYSYDDDGGNISFYPDNKGYQCYRISGEVLSCSNSLIKVFACAYHQGKGEELGSDDALSSSNTRSSFWTSRFEKSDTDDYNAIEVWTNFGYDDLEGSITVKWHIEKVIGFGDKNNNIEVDFSPRTFVYSGTGDMPDIKVNSVKVNGKTLQEGVNYKVVPFIYYNDTTRTGTLEIEGLGGYGDIHEEQFHWTVDTSSEKNTNKAVEKPAGTTIKKLKAIKKGFQVTWKKQAKQTNGYEIQYSLKKSMKSAKTIKIKKTSTVSKKISKLKSKKKYYVRIRTYRTVSGKNYYSAWSKSKSIKTK